MLDKLKSSIDDILIEDLRSVTNVYGVDRWEQENKIFDNFLKRTNNITAKDSDFEKNKDNIIEYIICEIIFPSKESIHYVSKNLKSRPREEAIKRREDDFKKNILPTLGRDEKIHFGRKYKK